MGLCPRYETAVSIPDDLFRRADELASRLGKSRSEIYREALAERIGEIRTPMEVRKHRRAEPIAMTEDSAAVKHGSRPLNRHAGRFEPQEFPTTPGNEGPRADTRSRSGSPPVVIWSR